MKKFKKKMSNYSFKHFIILLLLLCLYIFISAVSYVSAVSYDIADSVFRLHVIANSDSEEDQNLKYIVRDKLIEYMNTIAKEAHSKEEVINIAKDHSCEFKEIALNTIKENGFDYDVDVEIGNFNFPTKTYGDISLPAGNYDALRVKIGKAEGQNWWCVMFPPLCFVDVSSGIVPDDSKEIMKSNMSEEEYSLISEGNNNSNNDSIKFKFKLIEMLQNSKIVTAQK